MPSSKYMGLHGAHVHGRVANFAALLLAAKNSTAGREGEGQNDLAYLVGR